MIQLYGCPTCKRETSTLALVAEGFNIFRPHCPACAPVPATEPHEFSPDYADAFGLRIGGVVKLTDAQARSIFSHGCVVGCDPQLAVRARTRV